MSRSEEFRADPTRRAAFIVIGAVAGLALAWFHWIGLLVGGALVSLPTMNWKRGVLAGIGFGVLVLLVFGGLLALHGSLGRGVEMGQITVLAVAIPLVLGAIGGLARTLV
ncbi:hypothetical protein A4G99_16950 [Haladaptatus sp. R4]|uniref:hypothetical protein n=1 Tax=Haladaptatus sp. R4 TaxID=1679489 RepID=UPI0007B4A146|nr:hypothetical protein [Haladaptatus sp. R4]KZN22805.1 hypothetical protein A4G99_16950 [Haladaptatus sp. R4]